MMQSGQHGSESQRKVSNILWNPMPGRIDAVLRAKRGPTQYSVPNKVLGESVNRPRCPCFKSQALFAVSAIKQT